MVHVKCRKITRKYQNKNVIKKKQKRNENQERCVCTKNCDSDIHLPGPYQIVLQLKHQSKTNRKQCKRGSSNAQALWFGFWSFSSSSSSVRSSANLCVIFVLHAFSSLVCFFHFIYQFPPPLPHRIHALILALLALKTIIQPSGNGTNLLTRNKRWPKFCFHTIFPGHGWRRMVAQASEHVAHAWVKQSQWKTLPHCHISSGC